MQAHIMLCKLELKENMKTTFAQLQWKPDKIIYSYQIVVMELYSGTNVVKFTDFPYYGPTKMDESAKAKAKAVGL